MKKEFTLAERQIIVALKGKELSAHQILKEIKPSGFFPLGRLHTILRGLKNNKLVESNWREDAKSGKRRYYKLTEHGRERT